MKHFCNFALLLSVCFTSCELAPRTAETRAMSATQVDLLAGWETFALSNGLKIFIKEDRQLPQACVVIGYKVGSVNETPGMTGSAHFIEHLMFKGTKNLSKGQIDQLTYEAGGDNNAFTDYDATVYHFQVSPEKIETFLRIEADRMRNCLFDPKEFEAERTVVIEEMNEDLDKPGGDLDVEFNNRMFEKLPYHSIIGTRKDLETVTRDAVKQFYDSYYQPNNAVLVVAGAIDVSEIKSKIETLFSKIPKSDIQYPQFPQEPPAKPRRYVLPEKKTSLRMTIGFQAPKIGTKDSYALDVLSHVLTGGATSRLAARLEEDLKLVPGDSVSSSNESRKYAGIFSITAEGVPGAKPEQIEKAVLEEIARLKKEPITSRELQKVRNNVLADYVYDKESLVSICQNIAYIESVCGIDYIKNYVKNVNAVTAEDVRAAADKYLNNPLVVISNAGEN